MPRITIPLEKQCTKIKVSGQKCTNAKYGGGEFCYQHSDKGLKREITRRREGKLYELDCDNCYLREECPHKKSGEKCALTIGLKMYDLDDVETYKRLLQKLIQMETESYIRVHTHERESGEGGDNVSKRFMRLIAAMTEYKKLGEREKAKKPMSLADLIATKNGD